MRNNDYKKKGDKPSKISIFILKIIKNNSLKFLSKLKIKYISLIPLSKTITSYIEDNCVNDNRVKEINKIRTTNIINAFWANTGALFGLLIASFSIILTILAVFISIMEKYLPNEILGVDVTLLSILFIIILSLLLTRFILLLILPSFIRNIVINLPPNDYAEFSLNNLNESEILTYSAYKMLELCDNFLNKVLIDDELRDLFLRDNPSKLDVVKFNSTGKQVILDLLNKINNNTINLSLTFSRLYYQSLAIRNLTSKKLRIPEREYSHHILRFSPVILDNKIHSLRLSIQTMIYLLDRDDVDSSVFISIFEDHLNEMRNIRIEVEKSLRSLLQLIVFKDTHQYIIGISSITSTSRSLNIFLRGISSTVQKHINLRNTINNDKIDIQLLEELKTLLYRSKAHYGMDLLVSVENYFKKKYYNDNQITDSNNSEIPEVLFRLKYKNGISQIKAREEFCEMDEKNIILQYQNTLKNLRDDLAIHSNDDFIKISSNFEKKLSTLQNNKRKNYIAVFGYSRLVRNVLKKYSQLIQKLGVNIFVFKQKGHEMIDTRIFRFELYEDNPNSNLRNTFTASDRFFYSLLDSDSNLIFLIGAEVYCKKSNLLLHTNTYQKRIEKFIDRLESNQDCKPQPKLWILAEDYKIFENFPPKDDSFYFRNEIFSDHYDEVDLYNFSKIKDNISLITN